MSKRKWKQSSVRIQSVAGMMDWVSTMRKFMNTAWVVSQQLRVLESFVRKGFFWYPEREGDGFFGGSAILTIEKTRKSFRRQ